MAVDASDDTELLAEAKRRFTEAWDADRDNRQSGLEDALFEAGQGGQWPTNVRKQREEEGSLCMEFSHLRGFVRQVANELRMQPPGINVAPAQSGDPGTAEVIEGLIRSIERNSKAQRTYAKAGEDACRCNMGFWRVTTEYTAPDSFDQDIVIRPIPNPFSVLYDPAAQDQTGRDARYCFVYDDMPRDEFEAQYKDKVDSGFYDVREHFEDGWIEQDTIRLAEYWTVEKKPGDLILYADGTTCWADDKVAMRAAKASGAMEKSRRKSARVVVTMRLLSGNDVLETTIWSGARIPIVPVWGEEARIGARKVRNGVITFAKDAQRLLNYSRSEMAQRIALSTKAPWLVTKKQIEGYENQWKGAAQGNPFALPYNPDPQVPGGKPERIQPAAVEIGLIQQAALSIDDLKATVGIYDASLGAKSNETSGIAINARQKEGDVGTFTFIDNVMTAIEETGRIIVDLIPHIYDGAREVRILGKDMQPAIITVNQAWVKQGPQGPMQMPTIDLTVGKYDVAVKAGPSVSTQRVELSQTYLGALQAAPQLAPVLLPRLAALQDVPDAEELADEIKQLLQPQGPPPVPAKDQANTALTLAKTDGQRLDNAAKAGELHMMASTIVNPAPAAGPGGQPGAPGASPGQSAPGFSFGKTSWSVT